MTRLSHDEQIRRNEMFAQGYLWCNLCNQFKSIEQFYRIWSLKDKSTNYGYKYHCIECASTKRRNKEQQRRYYGSKNQALKRQFVDLAGGCCQRCGYNEFVSGFDFHHVYPSEKKHNPTSIIYRNNFEASWAEVDKCCLLCRNCHIAYQASEWRAEFVKRDSLGWTVGQSLPLDDNRYH